MEAMDRSWPARAGSVPNWFALSLVTVVTALLAAGAAYEADPLPLILLASAATLPLVLFAVSHALKWDETYGYAFGVLLIVLMCATLRTREIADKSVDFQIVLKLGCIAAMYAMAASAMLIRAIPKLSTGLALWLSFFFYEVITCSYAMQPSIAVIETASNLAVFLFLLGFLNALGRRALVNALVASCFLLCCASVLVYFLVPQLGRMSDWVNGAFVPTSRLTGVFGTANGAGAAAGVGILITTLLSGLSHRRLLFYVAIAPMLFCLIVSNNRMAVLAVAIALFYVYLARGHVTAKLAVGVLVAGLGLLLMASFGDDVATSLSRSGSADEITSGTGRTRVWAVVIDLWTERPWFGYGEGSAKLILPVHPLLFKAAAHAHDMLLNILFAGGAVGLSIFLAALWTTLRSAIRHRRHTLIALLIFQFVYGITEPTIGGLVSVLSMCLYAVAILALIDGPEFAEPPPPPRDTSRARAEGGYRV